MRIFLKTGVMIKVHGKDPMNAVNYTQQGCIFLTGKDKVRAIFPTESVDFIDLENDEATDLKMEIFPPIK